MLREEGKDFHLKPLFLGTKYNVRHECKNHERHDIDLEHLETWIF